MVRRMTSRRFPLRSLAVVAVSAAVLLLSGRIAKDYCAFGFGGFQCNSPFQGYGEALFMAVLASPAVLGGAAIVFLWRLVLWLRAARIS